MILGNFRVHLRAHSITVADREAISFQLCYERFIHAEFMTHRWSRNASSSRAIPYQKMKDWIISDPAMPLHIGKNKAGMQSGIEIADAGKAREELLSLLEDVFKKCDILYHTYDIHKEVLNRYSEPWGWINVIATMGRPQLMNFFKLRIDPYAHPNIQRLAVVMARADRASQPRRLKPGEWHLPFADDMAALSLEEQLIWSVARCAWVSYQTVDGKVATFDKAKIRHDDCIKLKHMTPCEHQLRARDDNLANGGPIRGYDQYRHMIADESADDFDFTILDTVYKNRDYVLPN